MKLGLLAILAFLPISALGQQPKLVRINDATPPVLARIAVQSTPGEEDSSVEFTNPPESSLALAQGPAPAPERKGNPPQPQPQTKPGDEISRPTIAGSMVGYIDNAIVGSQIVVRFENEIQNLTPDLAEFLYPRCNCPGVQGQGPGAGPPGLVTNTNAQILHMYGEYAVNRRFSVLGEVPVRWLQPQTFASTSPTFANQAGLSDVIAGFKLAMLASPAHYVTFAMQSVFPSGNAAKGLGTNHYSVQGSVLYYQRVTTRFSVESEFGDLHPIGGSQVPPGSGSSAMGGYAGDILIYGVGPSYKLFNGQHLQFTPLVEFIGWRVLGGYVTGAPQCPDVTVPCSAAGSNMLNLKGGARVTFGAHDSVYVGYGRALTGLYWHLRVYKLEYRHSF